MDEILTYRFMNSQEQQLESSTIAIASLNMVDSSSSNNDENKIPTKIPVVDDFLHTPDFRRHFINFVFVDTLMSLRCLSKSWNTVVDSTISLKVKSGSIIVHNGNDVTASDAYATEEIIQQRRQLAFHVAFLLNVTKVGDWAFWSASNLVFVSIPLGVEMIGESSFFECYSLTTVSFPKTLKKIKADAFRLCSSLETVDLLHTNLREICKYSFRGCHGLRKMTVPDSLQMLGENVFLYCEKLVPSEVKVADSEAVIRYLRNN